jgi:hypothetical protein
MDGDKKFVLAAYAVVIGVPVLLVGVLVLAGIGVASLVK